MTLQKLLTRAVDLFYIPPVAALLPRQTFRYAVCGCVNVAWSWVLYFLVYNFLLRKSGMDLCGISLTAHVAAMLIVFPVTFLTGFWLNRHIAFSRSSVPHGEQLLRYLLSVAGSVVVNYLCLKFFVEVCGCWATPSQMMASLVTFVYSYLAAKYFTFRQAGE